MKNPRFTDSMLDVFSRVAGIVSERTAVILDGDAATARYVPAVRVSRFAFSGKTEFYRPAFGRTTFALVAVFGPAAAEMRFRARRQ